MSQTSFNNPSLVAVIRRHLEPTLEMLTASIDTCPDECWDVGDANMPIWQHAYHALYYLDFWLQKPGEDFSAPTFHNEDAKTMKMGAHPSMTRSEIQDYRDQVYAKCREFMDRLTSKSLTQSDSEFAEHLTFADRLLGQIRHVQHHVGCMSAVLRRRAGVGPPWRGFAE